MLERDLFEPEHRIFRDAVRQFCKAEISPYHAQWERDGMVSRELWLKAGAQGLLCMDVAEQYGGGGLADFRYHMILGEELARIGASGVGFTVHSDVIVPYLTALGTDEQKSRWLPGCVSGEIISAIAMTEPSAGSDLASLASRAVLDGDQWVVEGAKVWTSYAQFARWGLCLARSVPGTTGPRGLSLLVLDMTAPGVDIRPLVQITGEAEFNEVFLDGVFVPEDQLVGSAGQGWAVASTTLAHERGTNFPFKEEVVHAPTTGGPCRTWAGAGSRVRSRAGSSSPGRT